MPTLAHDGAELNYTDTGSGPPLLFLHGLGSSSDDWELQVAHFAGRYRVLALDFRSSGQSRDLRQPNGPFTVAQFASDARALIESLTLGPTHVVGLSLGGAVAFQLACDAPALMRTMTICNSTPSFQVTGLAAHATILLRRVVTWVKGPRGMAQLLAPKLFPAPEHAALRAKFIERMARNRPGAYAASQRAVLGWGVADRLPSIEVPTLVVGAEFDYPFLANKQVWVRRMPNARYVEVPGTHHALPIEAPAAFNEVLDEFLREHA